ncbi:putative indolepyruvate decarboxylase family protein TDEL_0B05520 [Torulaspora delbrueckii]|uniref:2-hydroxyacyl-CoA lyase n=1 Tax=Torulaspora delbrueckii TaxID=4950 RepID=G8ZPY7_TORDE|nr:hypothetical protein TDEL_0B05520 [Torulaspora delbrueckii]CCE90681.1 hypothetical protein TDEL_0B05520 [Torulaspora delbrueckii]
MTLPIPEYFTQLLQQYGVDTVFGIVGIPIVELADTMIGKGIKFIACRNEQSASYAASAYGYLTGKPGVLLVVGGPGLIHALAGIYNSMSNRWPLIVIAGSSEDLHKGGFQELDQVSLLSDHLKFTGKLTTDPDVIELVTYNAMRLTTTGTPGVTYIDFPGSLISESIERSPYPVQSISRIQYMPDTESLQRVVKLLSSDQNKRILVVIGKGAVNASNEVRKLINDYNLPFLSTPMAKGVVPDSHPLNASSARSKALKEAEIVLVLGARLNWILHFGAPPKWDANTIFIQVDCDPESLGQNNQRGVGYSLCGDIGLTVKSLIEKLKLERWAYQGLSRELRSAIKLNHEKLAKKEQIVHHGRLNYNKVYQCLRTFIDDSRTIIVSEGANTMDQARISFPTDYPKHRLDAGTNATMGIGLGYAIAAKIARPDKSIVLLQGDSAFGFSAMEIETAVRNRLGLVIIVMNNSGIYHGVGQKVEGSLPSTALSQDCRYDLVGQGLGAVGYIVHTLQELENAFKKSLQASLIAQETSVINVIIEAGKQGKLSFGWQTVKKERL